MAGSPLRRTAVLASAAMLVVAASSGAPALAKSKKAKLPSNKVPAGAHAGDGAKVTSQKWLTAHELDITIKSPALAETVKARVLVPKGWSAKSTKRYPVLYAFHGGRDHYTAWTKKSDIVKQAYKYNVMVVMPEGDNGSYTDWYNYGKYGAPRWETFHTTEVRQIVEGGYHAGGSRAVMGLSSGGQGAITYTERFPGLYKYAASYSGPLSIRAAGVPALLMFTIMGGEDGIDPFRVYGIPRLDDVNWRQHDPYYLMNRLRGTGVYISSGTTGKPGPGDNPKTAPWDIGLISEKMVGATNISFRDKAKQLGIPVTSHLYGNGRHNWPAWDREYKLAWPYIMKAIGAKKL